MARLKRQEAIKMQDTAGWCMAGMVVKVKWFFERAAYWKNKKLSIVAVGASPNDNPEVDEFLNSLNQNG